MLCANVATAEFLLKTRLPALYRVHEGPNEEKLGNLYEFLRSLGIGLAPKSTPSTSDYQHILQRLKNRPDYAILQTLVIRSLKQARYQPENIPHFGLGYDAYTHFTSPIRRYPDLLVHRALRYLIRNPKQKAHVDKVSGNPPLRRSDIYPYNKGDLEKLGEHLSATERRADAASYDVIAWLKCEYMKERLGAEFDGTVVAVTNFGLFVELSDIYIDGLVHVTALDNDYYHFDAASQTLSGERSGATYRLGDTVRVLVARVDVDERKIDLQLISATASRGVGSGQPKRTRASAKGGRRARA